MLLLFGMKLPSMDLTRKQSLALKYLQDQTTTDLLYGGGAGGGKSILGAYWLLKMAVKYKDTRWLMGRSELRTLKETTLVSFFKVCEIQQLKAGTHYKFNEHKNTIVFPNKSVILLKDLFAYPSDPNFDSLGSLEITGGFIDECNQVTEKAKDIVRSRIRHALDENKLAPKLLMTCNPAKNWVYREFYSLSKTNQLPNDRKFIQALVGDNDKISKTYYDNLLKLDKNSKERLLYGNWEYDDDPSVLINYDAILNSYTNSFLPGGTKYITADIARFGKDKTVIGVWDDMRVKIYTFTKLSVTESANKIDELRKRHSIPMSNVLVDEDGVGGGVMDVLGCKGFVNNSRPLDNPATMQPDNYSNLKSQCYFMMAADMNNALIFIDCDATIRDTITEELEQVKQWKMDQDGKKQVIPKDKVKELIGRSPDYSDMMMMRQWFKLAFKFTPSFI